MSYTHDLQQSLSTATDLLMGDRELNVVIQKFGLTQESTHGKGYISINFGKFNPITKQWSGGYKGTDQLALEWQAYSHQFVQAIEGEIPDLAGMLRQCDRSLVIVFGGFLEEQFQTGEHGAAYVTYQVAWGDIRERFYSNPKSKNFGQLRPARVTREKIRKTLDGCKLLVMDLTDPVFAGSNLRIWFEEIRRREFMDIPRPSIMVESNPHFLTSEMKNLLAEHSVLTIPV